MKKIIGGGLVALAGSILLLGSANAQNVYYTNSNGVEMTQLEYLKMTEMFSDRKVENLEQEEFDLFKDATILSSAVQYQRTISLNGEVVKEEIISEEEYNQEEDNLPVPYVGDYQYYETTSKRIAAQIASGSTGITLIATLSWKKIPTIKSYDVFAFRVSGFTHNTFNATQLYFTSNSSDAIKYDSTQPGYKSASNGAGVSMNLVDSGTAYELTMTSKLAFDNSSSTNALAYVSYQHAIKNVTREISKSYTFDVSGYGNVVLFNNSTIASYYDGMSGLQLVVQK